MYYKSAFSRMIENGFASPYLNLFHISQTANFVYDSIETNNNGSTTISVLVPGFAKEDLELTVSHGKLSLLSKDKDKSLNKFWNLADTADTKNITAECKNGILNITIAGKQNQEKTRTIEIK